MATTGANPGTQMEDPPRPSLNREGERLEAADNAEGGEQGRESGNNHLDDCLDDVLFHSLSERPSKSPLRGGLTVEGFC